MIDLDGQPLPEVNLEAKVPNVVKNWAQHLEDEPGMPEISIYLDLAGTDKFTTFGTYMQILEITEQKISEYHDTRRRGLSLGLHWSICDRFHRHAEQLENRKKETRRHEKEPKERKVQFKDKMSHKGKIYPKVECPHCGKRIGMNVAKTHHFENCKNKST